MKIGINLLLWSVEITDKHDFILEDLKKVGYDGVEIFAYQIDDFKYYENLRKKFDSFGLECTVISGADESVNPISADASIRKAAVERFKKLIDICHIMGSPVLGGPTHSAYKVFPGGGPTEEDFSRAAEVYQAAAPYAEQNQVYLMLEVLNRFECYFLNTAEQIKKLLDLVNHEYVGYHFDTHHSAIEEYCSKAALELHGTQNIKHIHISENNRGIPGIGSVEWNKVFEGIKSIGYDGWLTIEAFSREDAGFADSINVWRNYSSSEKIYRKGFEFIKNSVR